MKKVSYEEAMKKLGEIVSKLEGEDLPLEESLKLFEEGTKLVGVCNSYLDSAQQKITELTKLENTEE